MQVLFKVLRIAFAVALPLLGACAATKAPVYPKAAPLTVAVSKGTVNLDTEVPANDYLIPGSQVFAGGRESNTTTAIAGGFGLIGAAIGMSINRSRNASGLEGTEETFRLSFADMQAEAFFRNVDVRAPGGFTPMKSGANASLVLIPSTRITFGEGDDAYIAFKTKVSFRDGDTAEQNGKHFLYVNFVRRRILGENGWAEDGAKALKEFANKAMPIISEVIQDDIGGRLQRAVEPVNPRFVMLRIKSMTTPPLRVLVLKEYAGYIAVAPAPKERVFHSAVNIYDTSAVEILPAQN